MAHMSQFYEIEDYEQWLAKGLGYANSYSTEENRFVYALKEDQHFIGFALINKHLRFNTSGHSIAEFYIDNAHQKSGNGRKLAQHVFDALPGLWEVAVTNKNKPARNFWHAVLSNYTDGRYNERQICSYDGIGLIFNNA